ncbi:MAG: hypothetical protein V1816_11225, partial [Pseudomonadota bacterium]
QQVKTKKLYLLIGANVSACSLAHVSSLGYYIPIWKNLQFQVRQNIRAALETALASFWGRHFHIQHGDTFYNKRPKRRVFPRMGGLFFHRKDSQ